MRDLYILKGDDNFYDIIRGDGESKAINRTICIATIVGMRPLSVSMSGCSTSRGIRLKRKLSGY